MHEGLTPEIACPLGARCEEIREGKLQRCAWFIALQGKNPQNGKDIDRWGCAIGWLPLLLIENTGVNKGQTAALESFRNETVKGQKVFNSILEAAANQQKAIGNG